MFPFRFFIYGLLVFVIASGSFFTSIVRADVSCPKTDAEWKDVLESLIFDLVSRTRFDIHTLDKPFEHPNLGLPTGVDEKIKKYGGCFSKSSPTVQACFAPALATIKDFTNEKLLDEAAGTGIPDEAYRLKYDRYLNLDRLPPELLDPETVGQIGNPKEFPDALKKLQKHTAEAGVKSNPWEVIDYASDLGGVNRLIVVIPNVDLAGDQADVIVQYTDNSDVKELNTPEKVATARRENKEIVEDKDRHGKITYYEVLRHQDLLNMNIITVQKTSNGKPLLRPILHFQTTDLDPHTFGHKIDIKLNSMHDPQKRNNNQPYCTECHQGGFLTPENLEGRVDPTTLKDAKRFVSRLISYGVTRAAGGVPKPNSKTGVSIWGPPLGPKISPFRNIEFIAKCATRTKSAEGRQRIMNAMNCAQCHNGELLKDPHGKPYAAKKLPELFGYGAYERNPRYSGSLNGNYLIRHMIVEMKAMPLGAKLQNHEPDDLMQCLLEEANRTWKAALHDPKCPWFADQDYEKSIRAQLNRTPAVDPALQAEDRKKPAYPPSDGTGLNEWLKSKPTKSKGVKK